MFDGSSRHDPRSSAAPERAERHDMQTVKNFITDMDGVLIKGKQIIPGADRFIARLQEQGREYLLLTNNSLYTPRDLAHRLHTLGLEIPIERLFTSAMATADFLHSQRQQGTAFVVGASGLTQAIHDIGYVITDVEPDYVVLGETEGYNFESITKAVRLIEGGARFIATNPDITLPVPEGQVPGNGAILAALAGRASPRTTSAPGPPRSMTAPRGRTGASRRSTTSTAPSGSTSRRRDSGTSSPHPIIRRPTGRSSGSTAR